MERDGGMDAAALIAHLEKHLRVGTFPVGIRSQCPGEPVPKRAKAPLLAVALLKPASLALAARTLSGVGPASRAGV